MQSTINLFRHLYNTLPPLFPAEQKTKIAHALEHLENDPSITLTEIEDTMIAFGYKVWPWNQAYREFLNITETTMGEHFLLPKLSDALRSRFIDFKHCGGSVRDLHEGHAADFFTPEERVMLCEALVAMQADLRQYANQEVLGLGRERYLKRAHDFKKILDDIQKTLQTLRTLADNEQDHPVLAQEIRSQVRAFEYGLCYLGPEPDYDAVCQSISFFQSRREHLNRLKGIAVPVTIDFYSPEV